MNDMGNLKRILFLFCLPALMALSCDKEPGAKPEITLHLGENLTYRESDFELYDSSAHILYFKTNHPELDTLGHGSFNFRVNNLLIYTGELYPIYFSSMPNGPFITVPPVWYGNFALMIQNISIWGQDTPDPRNDVLLMKAFKEHELLHDGLLLKINSVQIDGSELTFSFTVTNRDRSDLLIIDPARTGADIFHYYNNPPTLIRSDYSNSFSCIHPHEAPPDNIDPVSEYTTQVKPGELLTFQFSYTLGTPILPATENSLPTSGIYIARFEYNGFIGIAKDQLIRQGARVWLGSVSTAKEVVIN
jgi:hypothetical protein